MKKIKLKIYLWIGKDMWMLTENPATMAIAEGRMKALNRERPDATYRLSQTTEEILSEIGGWNER